jgi:hypothetical protein
MKFINIQFSGENQTYFFALLTPSPFVNTSNLIKLYGNFLSEIVLQLRKEHVLVLFCQING